MHSRVLFTTLTFCASCPFWPVLRLTETIHPKRHRTKDEWMECKNTRQNRNSANSIWPFQPNKMKDKTCHSQQRIWTQCGEWKRNTEAHILRLAKRTVFREQITQFAEKKSFPNALTSFLLQVSSIRLQCKSWPQTLCLRTRTWILFSVLI